jgi:hypothetical protein
VGSATQGQELEIEAALVARLASILYSCGGIAKGNGQQFFKRDCFLMVPTHEKRRLLTTALESLGHRDEQQPYCRWAPNTDFNVLTVDKAQGQTSTASIVSYGLFNSTATAGATRHFFNTRRLNVAITRAEAKTVLVISDTLLTSPAALANPESTHALKLLKELTATARQAHSYVEIPCSELVGLTVCGDD